MVGAEETQKVRERDSWREAIKCEEGEDMVEGRAATLGESCGGGKLEEREERARLGDNYFGSREVGERAGVDGSAGIAGLECDIK